MKILHLISSSGLYGAENVVLNLAGYFNAQGTETWISALRNTNNPNIDLITKAQEEGIPTFVVQNEGLFDVMAPIRLRKFVVNNKIDLLHTHNYKSDLIGYLTARISRIPIVATAHGFTKVSSTVTVYEKIDRWLLRNAFNQVIVVTDQMFKNCPANKRRVIPNGLTIKRFSLEPRYGEKFRAQWGFKESDIIVGHVGRLSREKNQILTIEAAETLVKQYPNLKFLFVGSGPEENKLKKLVRSKMLDGKIVFTGIIKEMPPVYQAIDLFVLPSQTEGIPLTILEAMASKVPVIASRVGGIPDMIQDGKTGLLMDAITSEELSLKIGQLINDPALQKQLVQTAFEFVSFHYSIEPMCEAYRQIYQELLRK